MGECIISRAAGEPESVVPVTPGYHTILVTLRDPDGALMGNYPINCVDGSTNYSYTTNAKGQALFVCNSGAANIFVNNYNGSYQYLDINSCWTNIDAPVGLTTKVNINLNYGASDQRFNTSKLFELYKNRICDVQLVGGGGGGMTGYPVTDENDNIFLDCWISGGGSGYLSEYNNQNLNGQYNFQCGVGGSGGYQKTVSSTTQNYKGNAGGTSYIVGTDYSANGGAGGYTAPRYDSPAIAIGGLGNGMADNGETSPVNFAGGGGAGFYRTSSISVYINNCYTVGGSPYGGNSVMRNRTVCGNANGSNGGGGGAILYDYSTWSGYGTSGSFKAGSGGNGFMRIVIHY